MDEPAHVVVVGGGLVGALQALLLAKRGFKVDLFEKRQDIRKMAEVQGRSINLALSHRGKSALKEAGLEGVVLDNAIPMYCRKIHSLDGKLSAQPYGKKGQCIYSVDRQNLNKLLLDSADRHPNISLNFEHQLSRAKLENKRLTFLKGDHKTEVNVRMDFIFGCDGAFSTVRRQMMRYGRLDYSQVYIEHGYKELTMPAVDGNFAMDQNCLHIWPRGEFMMIGLPNQDRSFTMTLFMPYAIFESIDTEEDLLAFFMKHFPDSLPKIGANRLVQDYFKNPTGSLISVKCKPHYMARSTVILGDAAHAIVPFYGQGMNAGFEDTLIFYEYLEQTENNLEEAASLYSTNHWQDCHTIADLSFYNYLEMRSHTASRLFVARKYLDNFLHFLFPRTFIPLYTMVAFTRIPYAEVVRRNERQRKFVDAGLFALKLAAVGGVLYLLYRWSGMSAPLRYRILPCVAGCVAKEIFN